MAQRILERGEIEKLASSSIPRVRLPDRTQVFAQRAERLRSLADGSPIGDYLRLCAAIADAQHIAVADFPATLPDAAQLAVAHEHRMPPIAATTWPIAPQWRSALRSIAQAVATQARIPPQVAQLVRQLASASDEHLDAQADAILGRRDARIDIAGAPFVMAALQVNWLALSSRFAASEVTALDVPGVCPLCGSLPVASVVRAQGPYQGHRYLHCELCACEWHRVRVQCSQCGADGKDIVYHSLSDGSGGDEAVGTAPLRAESCGQCGSYRKILYHEHDMQMEPVADDLASLALDVLLAEEGYARASQNPLLWSAAED